MRDLTTLLAAIAVVLGAHYLSPWIWLALPGAIVLAGTALGMAESLRAGIAAERSGSPTSGGER
jgi:hypothetical protein